MNKTNPMLRYLQNIGAQFSVNVSLSHVQGHLIQRHSGSQM